MRNIALSVIVVFAGAVLAQDLVPATSEDLMEFDRQVSRHIKKENAAPKQPGSAFGASVAAEAKKLRDADKDKRSEFGKWVSDQRKRSDNDRPSAQDSIGGGTHKRKNGLDGKGNSGGRRRGNGARK